MLSSLSQGIHPIEAKGGVPRGEDLVEEAKEKSPIAGAIRALAVGDFLWGMSRCDLSLTVKSGGRAEAGAVNRPE